MKLILIFLVVFCSYSGIAQKQNRYLQDVFEAFDTIKNIQYGQALNIKGELEKLYLDFYHTAW
jgi:hypothetical protein